MAKEEAYFGGDERLNRADEPLVGSCAVRQILNEETNPLFFQRIENLQRYFLLRKCSNFVYHDEQPALRKVGHPPTGPLHVNPSPVINIVVQICCGSVIVDANSSYLFWE